MIKGSSLIEFWDNNYDDRWNAYICKNCGKEFEPPRYYWKGESGEYCSLKCATFGYPNAVLIKDEI